MIHLGGRTILLGGFHDHWSRTNTRNPALLLAAVSYYHYDFMCLMDGESEHGIAAALEAWLPGFRAYVGVEEFMGWGHVVTVGVRKRVILPPDLPPREAFAAYEASCDFVAMAHPDSGERADKVLTYEQVGALMDEGVIRATQIGLNPKTRAWYQAREAAGKLTPIISGWDVHQVYPLPGLPLVLYGPDRKPEGHIDSSGRMRTLVFAEENTFPAIRDAVLRGDSLVEDLNTGELLGPAKWVDFLEQHKYRDAIAKLDTRRDATRLTVDRPPVAGESVVLSFPAPGRVRVAGTLDAPVERETAADGTLATDPLPAPLDRDLTYLPVVQVQQDGYARAWALALEHPVQLDVLPKFTNGQPQLELHPRRPFQGNWTLSGDSLGVLLRGDESRLTVDLPGLRAPLGPMPVRLEATSASGVPRTSDVVVTGVIAPRFGGNWDAVLDVQIAEDCAPGLKKQYGANRDYPGADVFSGRMQLAWTPEALLVRMTVVDAVHFQPLEGHMMFHGDSLQLALDPLLRREDGIGAVYVFNYCLGPKGPEVFRWLRPNAGFAPGYQPPQANVKLGGKEFLTVEPWDRGMVYTLRLPWNELALAQPEPGARMGIFVLMFNNDGQGLLDTLQWPYPITTGMWLVPRRWGVVALGD